MSICYLERTEVINESLADALQYFVNILQSQLFTPIKSLSFLTSMYQVVILRLSEFECDAYKLHGRLSVKVIVKCNGSLEFFLFKLNVCGWNKYATLLLWLFSRFGSIFLAPIPDRVVFVNIGG